MLTLNDRQWIAFDITGENGVFELSATKSGIDKNKLNNAGGNIAYITRSESNNGINMFVCNEQDSKYKRNEGNVITIGLDTQTCFYQPSAFYTGQNIQVLSNNIINKYSALFICTLLKQQLKKFCWGGNGATLGRLRRTKFLLPVTVQGEPDFNFMEEYVKERVKVKRTEYLKYSKDNIQKIKRDKAVELGKCEWKEFFIKDIFPQVQRGKRLTKERQNEGSKPYVSSSALNNGVDNFISNEVGIRSFSNCLSLANSGSVGACFYEPFEFVASDHVTHLKRENLTSYQYLFMATMLGRLSEKYNFNREINDARISREKVFLPVDNDGNPNFALMEQYAQNIMLDKYKSYIDYCKNV